jgi:hypothetical protein
MRGRGRSPRGVDNGRSALAGEPQRTVTVIVGQIRSTAVDLLRGSGMTYDEAAEAVRGAADAATEE